MRHLLRLLFVVHALACCTTAQTVNQWELRKRTSTGFQSYGLTAENGKAIGFTGGVPAMLTISGTAWGSITGTLSSQTDLQAALDAKAPLASPTFTGTVTIPGGSVVASTLQFNNGGAITTVNATGLSVLRSGFTAASQLVFPGRNSSLRTYNLPDIDSASITLLDTATAASTYLTSSTAASTYLRQDTAASTYQPLNANLTALAVAPISEGFLFNDGSNGLSYLPRSSGSGLSSDASKVAVHTTGGRFLANDYMRVKSSSAADVSTTPYLEMNGSSKRFTYAHTSTDRTLLTFATPSGVNEITVPARTGTVITTGDTGTITDAMLAGSIGLSKLSITGTPDGTKYLRGDGAWTSISSGATLGANTFTALQQFSGTDHAGLRLNNLTTTQRDALASPAAGMVIWNTTDGRMQLHNGTSWTSGMVRLAGDTMTGNLTVPNVILTANTGTFQAITGLAVPQFTATGSTGNGMRVSTDRVDFWINSAVQFVITSGNVNFGSSAMAWSSNTLLFGNSDGTGRLVQRNGTSPQTFSIANTYTSFTNKEEFEIGWVGNSNICRLRPIKGSSAGSSRNAEFHTTETGVNWGSGTGSPEGVRTAPVGSLYTRTDGGANTTLYVKESGTGNTGWIAK